MSKPRMPAVVRAKLTEALGRIAKGPVYGLGLDYEPAND